MPTNYPTSIDTYPAPGTNLGSTPTHATMHINTQDAMVAVQTELGANPSGAYATVAARLGDIEQLGTRAYAQNVTGQVGVAAISDVTGLSVTWTAVPGRRYRITASLEVSATVANDLAIVHITDAANNQRKRFSVNVGTPIASAFNGVYFSVIETGLSGSVTRKVRIERAIGTGTLSVIANATNAAFILVEDIGF